jgi:hypothetical protein
VWIDWLATRSAPVSCAIPAGGSQLTSTAVELPRKTTSFELPSALVI